jgi:hypothetical protein
VSSYRVVEWRVILVGSRHGAGSGGTASGA